MMMQTQYFSEPADWFLATVAQKNSADLTPSRGLEPATAALGSGDARVAVFYLPPVAALARRLAAGGASADALTNWTAECTALLDLYRQHRSRMALFEIASEDAPSQTACAALAGTMNGAEWPAQAVVTTRATEFEPLAALVLDLGDGTRDLIDQLQAATGGGFAELALTPALLETALAAQRQTVTRDEIEKLQARLDEAQGVKDVLATQGQALEESLRRSEAGRLDEETKRQAQSQEITTLKSQLVQAQKLKGQLDEAQRLKDEAEGLRDVLATQAQALEENLRRSDAGRRKDAAAHQAELDESQVRLDEAQGLIGVFTAQVGGLETSLRRSDAGRRKEAAAYETRLTSAESQCAVAMQQVRDQRETLRQSEADKRESLRQGDADRREAATELRAQSAKTDAALQKVDSLTRSGAVLQKQIGDLQAAVMQSENDRVRDKTDKQRLDMAWRRQVTNLATMLEDVQNSTSWRVTGPVRSVIRRFKR